MLMHHSPKSLQITDSHGLSQLQVRSQCCHHPLLEKNGAVRNFAHEQLDDAVELVHRDAETPRGCGRSLADGMRETTEGVGVVELDGLDPSRVVQVTCVLVVRRSLLGEGCLANERISLLEKVVLEVISEEEVDQYRLPNLIVPQRCGSQRRQKGASNLVEAASKLEGARVIEENLGREKIHRPAILTSNSFKERMGVRQCLLDRFAVNEENCAEQVQVHVHFRQNRSPLGRLFFLLRLCLLAFYLHFGCICWHHFQSLQESRFVGRG
mmetsp:Transcript_38726/g.83905  ORF Transcript_38726/g.83905 Transcript_38726/m.83905 type:complete len:268 (+) Transcript_38726:494-1297(+)